MPPDPNQDGNQAASETQEPAKLAPAVQQPSEDNRAGSPLRQVLRSIVRALRRELSATPLTFLLNLLQTTAILIAVVTYLQTVADPPKTAITIPATLLQQNEARRLAGGITFVQRGDSPIEQVAGYAIAMDGSGKVAARREIRLAGPVSPMVPALTLDYEVAPARILFCLRVVNEKGGVTRQRVVLALDRNPGYAQLSQIMALYRLVPEAEAASDPGPECRL